MTIAAPSMSAWAALRTSSSVAAMAMPRIVPSIVVGSAVAAMAC
jgi:hypothetical protein